MDTPISWIKAYVPDLDCTPQEYADKMTYLVPTWKVSHI